MNMDELYNSQRVQPISNNTVGNSKDTIGREHPWNKDQTKDTGKDTGKDKTKDNSKDKDKEIDKNKDKEKDKNKEKDNNKFKDKTAVALRYGEGDDAPRIIASGKGYLAEKILNAGKAENIPIHQDAKLTDSLSKIEIGEYIPTELYEVVAEILVYLDRIEHIRAAYEKKD